MWQRPSDTGVGNSFGVPIFSYIAEISVSSNFSTITDSVVVPSSEAQIIFSFIFSNLQKGQTYYGRALAITFLGNGIFSPSTFGSVAADVPSSPNITSVITGSVADSNLLSVFWTAPSDTGIGNAGTVPIVSYLVEISNTSQFSYVIISQNLQPSSHSATLESPALIKGINYYARLFASTAVGSSPSSNQYKRLFVSAPSPPTDVTLIVSGPLQLRLTWEPPSDAGAGIGVPYPLSSYIVQVFSGLSSTEFRVSPSDFSTNITYFNGAKLIKGSIYYASVYAVNDAENGVSAAAQSSPKTAVDLSGPPASAQLCAYDSWMYPTAGACTEAGPLSLLFTWTVPSDSGAGSGIVTAETAVLAYNISISLDVEFSSVTKSFEIIAAGPDTSFTFTGLVHNSMYWARVRAITNIGAGDYAVSVGQIAVDIPGAPLVTDVQSKSENEVYHISLSWNLPADTGTNFPNVACLIISYIVTVSKGASFSSLSASTFTESLTIFALPLEVGALTAQSQTISFTTTSTVQKGSTYYIRVQARNAVGVGNYSNPSQLLVTGYPGQPTIVTLSVTAPLTLLVVWSPPADMGAGPNIPYYEAVFEYLLWNWTLGAQAASFPILGQWLTVPGGINTTSYQLAGRTKGQVYKVAIRAVNLADGDPSLESSGTGGGLWLEDNTAGVVAISLPTIPVNFSLRPSGNISLLAKWTIPADTGAALSSTDYLSDPGYEIQFCSNQNCTSTVSYKISREKLDFSISALGNRSLIAGEVVEGRIRAINPAGLGQWSAYSQTTALTLPGVPTNISTLLGGEQSGLVVVYVSFDPPTDTGLGIKSTLAMLTSIQIQSLAETSETISCTSPVVLTIESLYEFSQRTAAVTGLSKVRLACH